MNVCKGLLFCLYLFLNINPCFAQDKTLNGTILSAENTPLRGVTVKVRGLDRSTQTDASGNFSIVARKGQVLQLTYVGYDAGEVTVGDVNTISFRMRAADNVLETVTVAMDVKRKPKELGYSVQTVSGTEVAQTQRENFVNGLQGRVSGLTINPTSGAAGASSQIVLRGFNSLSLSNQPLFVIDGIIVDNSTVNEGSGGGTGVGLASDRTNRNNDYSNRMSDINPNDIESITVLKGPEATALYGSQASSGAVIITTKKAKSNKLALQYDNSFRVQSITRYPETLDNYMNGQNGVPGSIFRYFGPENSENTPYFDNKRAFFKTGFAQTHNIGADFGIKNSIFRASGSYYDQAGVVPNNNFKRITARISNTTKIGKFLELIPSLSYTRSENDKVLRSAGGYLLGLLVWPSDQDILNYQDEFGNKLRLFENSNLSDNEFVDNPLFNVNANQSRDVTNRYVTTLGVNLNPFPWLTVAGRFGYDQYQTNGYTRYHPQSFYISKATLGQQDNFYRRYNGYNHTITATGRKTMGDFSVRVMGGTMWQDYQTKMFAVAGNGLIDSFSTGQMYKNGVIVNGTNFNSVVGAPADSNSTRPNSRTRLLRNNFGEFNKQIVRQLAYFGEFSVGYKDLVFLNYTHRFESASTLPEQNRNYNYPGASLSVIVSDIFPKIKEGRILNYVKLRTSLAQTARLNSPYSTQSVFVNNFGSGQGFSYGFTNNNPDLEPEKQKTYEVGTELKLFNNKLGLDVTYYNTLNTDQIIEGFRLSYGTGFVLNTQNAGSTRNRGLEVSVDATPVRRKNFNWNVRFNFNRMYNEVIELPANVAEYYLSDTWLFLNARGGLVKGGPTTTITANSYLRNNNGDILINPANGFPLVSGNVFKVAGDRNPSFTLGTINSFTAKNWRFSFLWDLKVGGDIYNGTNHYLTRAGKSLLTQDRYTPRVVTGVLRDGKENSANPTLNSIVIVPANNDFYYTNLPDQEFIEKDVNWLRLRDVSLSYTFPSTRRFMKEFKSLGLFVTANDLVLITNYTGVDPSVNGVSAGSRGVGAFGFDFGTLPTPVSLNVGIRAGF